MGGDKIYVCSGAVLKCSMGTANGSLNASPKAVSLWAHEQANIADHISMLNVKSFGRCRSLGYPPTASATSAHHGHLTPMPCVPGTPTKWSAVDPNSKIASQPALLNTAKLKCIYGGTISIINPGQALETTGAKEITIVSRDIVISDYFWSDKDGNETDSKNVNAMEAPSLCMQTSLSEGSQLVVNLGSRSYPTIVGKNGVAKVDNVDVSEVSLDLPSKPRVAPKRSKSTSEGNTQPGKEKKQPTPAKATPVKTDEVNTATVPSHQSNGWGDPVANPKIRRNSPSHLFGKVRRDAKENPRNHQGFDYYAPTGTSIMSVGDGVIHTIQKGHSDYGTNITIRHTRGKGYVYSFYAHLSGVANGIVRGKVVRKGEIIGYAGTTGNAKGFTGEDQHLHFECRTSPGHQLGLGGKENPNNIVATKFTAQNIRGVKS